MASSPTDSAAPVASRPPNLPPKPPPLEDPSPESDGDSPPRKRPRTRAPTRTASSSLETPAPSQSIPVPQMQSEPVYRFSIQPLHRFHGASASIKRPREIAHFSYDDNHEYRGDESGVSYFNPPPMGADLKEGFETFRHYEDTEDPHLDSLLKALVEQERQGRPRAKSDFVTWRGMMTKIMTSPFDMFAEFSMFATLYDGTIYLEEDFPSRAAERASESARPPPRNPHQQSHKMMTYWGYKFETLSLLPTPPPNTPPAEIEKHRRSQVSNHAQHCSIITTSFGPHCLILGGEVDGLSAPKPNPTTHPDAPIPWIELKTAEELPPHPQRTQRDVLKFERKLLKFWAQSFLLGVEKVIVGYRSKQGILRGLDTFPTVGIPGMVRRGTNCWDGNTCINFATAFLGWLKETVKGEGVYKVTLRKKSGVIEVQKVRENGTGGIVSQEFLEWRKKQEESENIEQAEVEEDRSTQATHCDA